MISGGGWEVLFISDLELGLLTHHVYAAGVTLVSRSFTRIVRSDAKVVS